MPVPLRQAALNILQWEGMSPVEAIAFFSLIILIILSPIPYGGVTADEELRILLLAFCTGAISLAASWRRPAAGVLITIVSLPLLALTRIQLVPLPILNQFSPESLHIWEQAGMVLRSAGDPVALTPRISIAPQETTPALLLVLSYCAAFVGSLLTLRTRLAAVACPPDSAS